jgi:hypothetical protein
MKRKLASALKIGMASVTMSIAFSASAIIDGRSADPRIGKAAIYIYNERGENSCTGVVVHPRMILTAGHCVVDAKVTGLTFSNGSSPDKNRHSLPIAQLLTTKTYVGATNGMQSSGQSEGDLGVILMSEPILDRLDLEASDLPPIVRGTSQVTQPLHIIGYGYASRNAQTSDASRRELLVSATVKPGAKVLTLDSLEGKKSPCFGDSGSGVFSDDGVLAKLVGIVSSIAPGGELAERFAEEKAKQLARNQEKREKQIAKLRQKKAKQGLSSQEIDALAAEIKLPPIKISESLMGRVCGDADTLTQAVPVARHLCWIKTATDISLVAGLDCSGVKQ